jgi:hypothetical protein
MADYSDDAFQHVGSWIHQVNETTKEGYRHRQLACRELSDEVAGELIAFVRQAHADAAKEIDDLMNPSLAPFPEAAGPSGIPTGYPYGLHMTTLKGYFGEILAAVLIQFLGGFGHNDWEVPAFRFRVHVPDLYKHLESRRSEGTPVPALFGAHGDDCSVFRLDVNGEIDKYVICEAKCTASHDNRLIQDGHKQLSRVDTTAADIQVLLQVLKAGPTEALHRWWVPLVRLLFEKKGVRHHAFIYVYGRLSRDGGPRVPPDAPPDEYTATEPLEAFEIHVERVEDLIRAIYAEDPPWL